MQREGDLALLFVFATTTNIDADHEAHALVSDEVVGPYWSRKRADIPPSGELKLEEPLELDSKCQGSNARRRASETPFGFRARILKSHFPKLL